VADLTLVRTRHALLSKYVCLLISRSPRILLVVERTRRK
jgi:hypothetical protein